MNSEDAEYHFSLTSSWTKLLDILYTVNLMLKSVLEVVMATGGFRAIGRDIFGLFLYLKFQTQFKLVNFFQENVVKKFDKVVGRLGKKTAIHYGVHKYRFVDLQAMSYQVANWLEQEIPKTEQPTDGSDYQIGLMISNTPELAALIIGAARVKTCSVLFNTNHRLDLLKNALEATNCRMFIFDSQYLSALQELGDDLPDIRYYMYDRTANFWLNDLIIDEREIVATNRKGNKREIDINKNVIKKEFGEAVITKQNLIERKEVFNFGPILSSFPRTPTKIKYESSLEDNVMYLFTSGTTGGKVKATPLNNCRFIVGYLSQTNVFNIKQSDHIFISLPLFHSFPCVIGLGFCLIGGCTITLVDKFSASRFWNDCKKNKCTVALYIGEIARYLLAQPRHPIDTDHSVRMMLGLGMKKEVWKEFMNRFKIDKIAEFYGSSEGNINLFNTHSVEGACGFIPWYFGPITRLMFPFFLIKVDPITLEPIRTKNGLCKLAKPKDCGILVGSIRPKVLYTQFLGYTSKEETTKKVIRNVLSKGDQAFVSGDLFEMDLFGNLFFRDRTGDTFRWKGENVSTTEVESIAVQYLNLVDCAVYGVSIPHTDGCAGMIAIKKIDDFDSRIDLDEMYLYMKTNLPEYAIPKFVRFTDEIETTSTHKLIKYKLRQEGFDVEKIQPNDELYYFNKEESKYQVLDQTAWEDISNGFIKF